MDFIVFGEDSHTRRQYGRGRHCVGLTVEAASAMVLYQRIVCYTDAKSVYSYPFSIRVLFGFGIKRIGI